VTNESSACCAGQSGCRGHVAGGLAARWHGLRLGSAGRAVFWVVDERHGWRRLTGTRSNVTAGEW
jgi:hypothetical protein